MKRYAMMRSGADVRMVETADGTWVRHDDVARWWNEARERIAARVQPLVAVGGDDGLYARAEHIFQALTLKPFAGVSEFDVAEAAEVIRLLAVRLEQLQEDRQ